MHDEKNSKTFKLNLVAIILGFAVCSMIAIMVVPSLFLRQSIQVQILSIDAPRSCRDSSSLIFGPRGRSSDITSSVGYCGYIMTSYGTLFLPESSRISLFTPSREEMYDLLAEGCSYLVSTAGYGADIEPKVGVSNRGKRDLVEVFANDECV